MKRKAVQNQDAVSPVVGVMLMLVVTVIIAAIVSAFAGGLAETEQKAPQITLTAEANADEYILLEHLGGDPLNTGSVTVRTFIPAGTFKDMNYEIEKWGNQTYCPTNDRVDGGGYNWVVFQPGDQIKINWTDAFGPDYSGTAGGASPDAGETLNIEIYDKNSGKLIVNAQTIVLP
jgi:FlaG/FlaF family flagellin (archaellin)